MGRDRPVFVVPKETEVTVYWPGRPPVAKRVSLTASGLPRWDEALRTP